MECLIHVLNKFNLQKLNIKFLTNNDVLVLQKVKDRRPVRWNVQRMSRPGEDWLLPSHSMRAESEGSSPLIPKSEMRQDAENFHHYLILARFLLMLATHFLSDVPIDPLHRSSRKQCAHTDSLFSLMKCIATCKNSVAPVRVPLRGYELSIKRADRKWQTIRQLKQCLFMYHSRINNYVFSTFSHTS